MLIIIKEEKKEYQPRRMNSNSSNKKAKRKELNVMSILFKVLAVAFIIITIISYTSILKLDLLPNNYIIVFTVAEIIFTLLMVVGLAKTHRTYKLNIFCLILILLLSGIYLYVSNYANATNEFLGNVFQEVKETEEYYIVVRKTSEYESIEDIEGENVYAFQIEDDVKSNIEKKVNVTFETESGLTNLGNNLISKEINVLLLSSSQYNMLAEEIKDFKENTKILYATSHEIKKEKEVSDNNSNYTIKSGIFNIYISGIDTSGNISNVSRSDANILATVNTKTHEVLLTSIPRDYYVTLHSKGAKDKLTHSGIYGINETVNTVEDLLDVDINYYVRVNFTTVIKLVDTLGGINVYSEYDFSAGGYSFKQGYNYLNGEQALAFSRERYSFSGGDNQRVKNQQAVIEAIIKKVMNSTTILTKYTDIFSSLEGSFQTNIEQNEISSLVKSQLNNMSTWTIKNNALTGSGDYGPTYSMGSTELYIMIPNQTSVENAKDKIEDVLGK